MSSTDENIAFDWNGGPSDRKITVIHRIVFGWDAAQWSDIMNLFRTLFGLIHKGTAALGGIVVALVKVLKTVVSPFRPSKCRRTALPDGALSQTDVARDFHVTRQTVHKWETGGKNPYGYYRELRLKPQLRGAYEALRQAARAYHKHRAEAQAKGGRYRISFEQFNEKWLQHNKPRP